jgi:hypothetical protein
MSITVKEKTCSIKDDMRKCIHEIPWKTAKFLERVGISPTEVYIDSRKSWDVQHPFTFHPKWLTATYERGEQVR